MLAYVAIQPGTVEKLALVAIKLTEEREQQECTRQENVDVKRALAVDKNLRTTDCVQGPGGAENWREKN